MVRIEEVQDETEKLRQQGFSAPQEDDQDWEATDDESDDEDLSDDEEFVSERGLVVPNETLFDRIAALKDVLSPSTRASLKKSFNTASTYTFFGGWVAGKLIWIGVTSALLVGLPFALAVEDESRISVQEKELLAQQGGQVGAAPGLPADAAAAQAAAAQGQPQGLRPPGF